MNQFSRLCWTSVFSNTSFIIYWNRSTFFWVSEHCCFRIYYILRKGVANVSDNYFNIFLFAKYGGSQFWLTDLYHIQKYYFKQVIFESKLLLLSWNNIIVIFIRNYDWVLLATLFLGGWSLFLISLVCSMYYACVQSLMFKHYYCLLLLLVCMPTTYQHSLLHNTHNAQNTFTSMM